MTELLQHLIDRCLELEKFATLKLREDWANGADPIKLIGLADELGLTDLSLEFIDQLKADKELSKSIEDYHKPTELKSFGGH